MGNKYSGLQISIHWLVFLLVIVAYCAMEFRGLFPRSYRPAINMIHVSCGIGVLALMLARLVVRLKFPAPPIVPKPKPMMTGLAHLGHLVIYLLFIALPVIGLVMMYNRGNPWIAFGIVMPHAAEANVGLVHTLKSWHITLANLGYFVIALHAAAALLHHYFWKDNTLLRMMPRKR
ncbi:cytochrome b561 [Citrobacter rodentium]|jgi:Cytochrome B561|uniref:Cytochrome b561 (Cytochrome b-561) n=2 Tax=Citrobacter rodentium TaxID=67825 RepID=D2TJG6_CITRI|nr:cytochrome b561 [Citrobacter rodentium]KIQ49602.1 cytochrome b561 [Citrobacter rodentium]QBY28203.1 cytochrome b561 [Citrobacter rodentium]UHO29920.1 cytochrome b561 [Citrobacter rodentium NBRC 105723 = DSM 16636]CBG88382.1 cytochrome b561 (cytochrome b-561) [Citrobacter rodentium ICC168]HAT8011582.1 cytochrome b561 [Citrobacter rodentium NBRC 105723 = DSM 16636]